ncbi:MAG: HAMP domain-containing protein, partial [Acidobacteria bacterium]|nr:HAMP domain-containing protein [Acidobacteriota bacterium]
DSAFDTLLLYALSSLNFAAFIVFSFILIRNLLKLRRERRERQLGSKIKTRLVVYFITVSLLPITAMAVFSYLFLNRSLEKWFGRFPEDVVSEARLARTEDAAQRARSLRETAAVSALMIEQQLGQGLEPDLARLLRQGNFVALSLRGPDGVARAEVAAPATSAQAEDLKTSFSNAIGERGVRVEGVAAVGPFLIAAVPLGDGSTLLAARTNKDDTRLERIVSGSESFEALRREQRKVRMLGLSTLGLMTLLILFAATWSAIHLARGIGTPIRALAEAADQVARGNLSHRVTAIADDELALLAASFNGMTEQLEENRGRIETNAAELREKNMALAERRDYIETVLQSLSTGVISLDE